jgi:hypothetical protein
VNPPVQRTQTEDVDGRTVTPQHSGATAEARLRVGDRLIWGEPIREYPITRMEEGKREEDHRQQQR